MSISRTNWTPEVIFKQEDEIIKNFVEVQGLKKWTKISKAINTQLGIEGRSGKQCRERWHNHLDPAVNKSDFSAEEENKIFELQEQLGNKWSEIAELMPGRTENAVKNCFYSAIRRNLRKFNKKKPESKKLKGSIKSLLRKPGCRAILMNKIKQQTEVSEGKKKNFLKKSLKIVDRPNEIICPVISPLPNLSYFSFPITPSTTQSIVSTNYTSGFFNFNEKNEEFDLQDFSKTQPETQTELSISEVSTPKYFLPHFSPKTNFQHYLTPRNSFSKK